MNVIIQYKGLKGTIRWYEIIDNNIIVYEGSYEDCNNWYRSNKIQ